MKTLFTIGFCLGATMIFAQTALDLTTVGTFTVPEEGALLYRQHVTPNLPPDKKVPLILFLHGAGERGNDNAAQLTHGVTDLIKFGDANGGAIVIVPQCPAEEKWVNVPWDSQTHAMPAEPSASMKLVLALVNEKTEKMPVDPDRIYVTGLSMGGYGTWDIIQRRPKLFAAAIPICSAGDPSLAAVIKSVPTWIFHGADDDLVKVSCSHDMVNALKACGGNVQYREYPGVGHDSWTQTYADPDVLRWLFEQRRVK